MTPRDKALELSSVRITPKTAIYQITHDREQLWALICGVQTQTFGISEARKFSALKEWRALEVGPDDPFLVGQKGWKGDPFLV